jgi:hypothetical protein
MERRKYNSNIQDKQKRLLINKLILLHSNYMLDKFNAKNTYNNPKHLQIKHNTKLKSNNLYRQPNLAN